MTWCNVCPDGDVLPARGEVGPQRHCLTCGIVLEFVEPIESHHGGWAHPWSAVRAGADAHDPHPVDVPAHVCRQCATHCLIADHLIRQEVTR